MNRPDFEYGCECGYWLCQRCGTPWYPVEVDHDSEYGDSCPHCLGRVEFHPHKKQKLVEENQ